MFTRQHDKAIAEIVRTIGSTYRGNYIHELLASMLADYFIQDNPRFDRARFLTACGLEGY